MRDVGIFNDTLMRELLEELGQLKETDVVLVNWGAWYPRFTWGYTEVTASLINALKRARQLDAAVHSLHH